jgi:hypothetical protein
MHQAAATTRFLERLTKHNLNATFPRFAEMRSGDFVLQDSRTYLASCYLSAW